jgi:ATP-binding cassette, subfamily B, bacterial PglK
MHNNEPFFVNIQRLWKYISIVSRKYISHVQQAIFLSDATIKANIAFGSSFEKIDMARVQYSVERAQISKIIKGMILKLVSEVYVFTGGQCQRIAILLGRFINSPLS